MDGADRRLVIVEGRLAAAEEREAAFVIGDGKHTLRELIRQKNCRLRKTNPPAVIPLNAETRRDLVSFGLDYDVRPRKSKKVHVRRSVNAGAGGVVRDITEEVGGDLARAAQKIARLFDIPVMGVNFIVNTRTGRHWVVGINPDRPPENDRVACCILDCLFPRTKGKKRTAL